MNDITDSDNHAWLKLWVDLSKTRKDWDFSFIAEGRQFDPRFFTKEKDTKNINQVLLKCDYAGLQLPQTMLRGSVDPRRFDLKNLSDKERQTVSATWKGFCSS